MNLQIAAKSRAANTEIELTPAAVVSVP